MELLRHFHRQFAYDGWANQEAVASIAKVKPAPPGALRFLSHLVSAQWLWLERLERQKQTFEVWPAWSLAECDVQAAKLPPLWQQYLGGLKPAALASPVSYTNSKGERWTNAIADVLTHVLLHSAYHRGQVATDLRGAGH